MVFLVILFLEKESKFQSKKDLWELQIANYLPPPMAGVLPVSSLWSVANCELMAWVVLCGFDGHDWLWVLLVILFLGKESKFQSKKDLWEFLIFNF